jgi:hypothetical protein
MNRMILTFALLTASVFGAEIGRESQIGKLQIRTVESTEDVTVFAMGGNPETRAIEVDAIMNVNGQRVVKTGVAKIFPTVQAPVRITINTDGAKVSEIRIYELGSTMAATVQP